jgi:cation diffusion facilitator CzcD-associated flavoprotein CzcO
MRQDIESRMNSAYEMFFDGSDKQKMMRAYMEKTMKERLSNAGLEEKSIPKWSIGCRRLTPGVDYLERLSKPNVETVFGEVTQITEDGVVVNGMTEYPLEVIICATGFDTTFKPRFPISGIAGEQLANRWKGMNRPCEL